MLRPSRIFVFGPLNNYNDSYNRSDCNIPYILRYHKSKVNKALFKSFGLLKLKWQIAKEEKTVYFYHDFI